MLIQTHAQSVFVWASPSRSRGISLRLDREGLRESRIGARQLTAVNNFHLGVVRKEKGRTVTVETLL